jgi:hypothetical protein
MNSSAITQFTCFYELRDHSTSVSDARLFRNRLAARYSDHASESLLLAWLILRETTIEPVSRGLDYTLRKFLQRDSDPGFSNRTIGLLAALLEWWQGERTANLLKELQRLFELETGRKFLLHHESGGTEWFNKERFEELCEWITLLMLVEECKKPLSARIISTRLGAAERSLSRAVQLARDVGYRSTLFSDLTEKVDKHLSLPREKDPA